MSHQHPVVGETPHNVQYIGVVVDKIYNKNFPWDGPLDGWKSTNIFQHQVNTTRNTWSPIEVGSLIHEKFPYIIKNYIVTHTLSYIHTMIKRIKVSTNYNVTSLLPAST